MSTPIEYWDNVGMYDVPIWEVPPIEDAFSTEFPTPPFEGTKVRLYRLPARQGWVTKGEWLWFVLRTWCARNNHTLHYTHRGDHRIVIESGTHDGKRWTESGATFDQALAAIILAIRADPQV